jgi:hypothetical protein
VAGLWLLAECRGRLGARAKRRCAAEGGKMGQSPKLFLDSWRGLGIIQQFAREHQHVFKSSN